MVRAIAALLILFALIFAAIGVGIWRWGENVPVTVLPPRPAPEPAQPVAAQTAAAPAPAPTPAPDLQERLGAERRRLEDLRRALEAVRTTPEQPPTGSAERYIENLNRRIAEAQADLNELNVQQKTLPQATQFQTQTQIQTYSLAQLNLQNQITAINQQIASLQATAAPGVPDPNIPALIARRDLLQSQIESLRLDEKRALTETQQTGLVLESSTLAAREDLNRQIRDLKADLAYWRAQTSPNSEVVIERNRRIAELENEIRNQEQRVVELQNRAQPIRR